MKGAFSCRQPVSVGFTVFCTRGGQEKGKGGEKGARYSLVVVSRFRRGERIDVVVASFADTNRLDAVDRDASRRGEGKAVGSVYCVSWAG